MTRRVRIGLLLAVVFVAGFGVGFAATVSLHVCWRDEAWDQIIEESRQRTVWLREFLEKQERRSAEAEARKQVNKPESMWIHAPVRPRAGALT
jgi:hypothetical protein